MRHQPIIKMGLFKSIATICVLGLLTVEGLNPTLSAAAEKNAAGFIGHLAAQFKFDAKAILGLLPFLRYIALGAFAALIINLHNLLLVVYIFLTRGLQLQKHFQAVQAAIGSKGAIEGINSSVQDVIYILTTVGTIALLLDHTWSACCSSGKCATPKAATKK